MTQHTIVLDLDADQEAGLAYVSGEVDGDLYLKTLMESATRDYNRQRIEAKVDLIREEVKLGTADVISDVDATAVKAQSAKDAREAAKAQDAEEP